jgi:hypothetical protein
MASLLQPIKNNESTVSAQNVSISFADHAPDISSVIVTCNSFNVSPSIANEPKYCPRSTTLAN